MTPAASVGHGRAVEILHRSERVVVVMKPSGVPVHATRGMTARPLLQRVRDYLGQHVWPAHRLDAATSGAMVFARDPEAAARLGRRFAEGAVDKRYVALVRGVPPTAGVIDHPVPQAEGKDRVPAVTRFRTECVVGRYGWLQLWPRTGRRHQIRRHLKHMSWPIIGDVRYGKGDHNRHFRFEFGLCRLALHAAQIKLADPELGVIDAVAPLPDDLAEPLRAFGLSDEALGC